MAIRGIFLLAFLVLGRVEDVQAACSMTELQNKNIPDQDLTGSFGATTAQECSNGCLNRENCYFARFDDISETCDFSTNPGTVLFSDTITIAKKECVEDTTTTTPTTTTTTPTTTTTTSTTTTTATTTKPATEKCGKRVCVPEAFCRNDSQCRCATPYTGIGHVKCYQKDYISCHVIDDPYLTNFCREKASVPIPCRYRLASHTAGQGCEVIVYATNTLFLDYFSYATSVQISVGVDGDYLKILYDVTPGTPPVAYYKLGSDPQFNLPAGTYSYVLLNRTFVITLDASDGSFTVDSPDCALNVVFRPPLGTGAIAEQIKTPGVACTILGSPSLQGGYPETLCGQSTNCSEEGLGAYQSENALSTLELAALLAWLKSETRQSNGSQCETVVKTFNETCSTQALSTQAVNACGPIFSSPTIKCITKKFNILDLFIRCINAICSQDKEECTVLDMEVNAKCNVPTITAACQALPA